MTDSLDREHFTANNGVLPALACYWTERWTELIQPFTLPRRQDRERLTSRKLILNQVCQPDNSANFSHEFILNGSSRRLFWGCLNVLSAWWKMSKLENIKEIIRSHSGNPGTFPWEPINVYWTHMVLPACPGWTRGAWAVHLPDVKLPGPPEKHSANTVVKCSFIRPTSVSTECIRMYHTWPYWHFPHLFTFRKGLIAKD